MGSQWTRWISGVTAALLLGVLATPLHAQTVTVSVNMGFNPAVCVNDVTTASLSATSTSPPPPPYGNVDPAAAWAWSWQVVSPPPGAHVSVTPQPGSQMATVQAYFDQPGDYTIIIKAHVHIGSNSGMVWDADGILGTPPSASPLTTKAIQVQVNLPAGAFVGAGRDPLSLPLQAQPSPVLSGESYGWSVLSGPGNGQFDSPSKNTNFHGTTEGHVTAQVQLSYQGAICKATKALIVVRIDDLMDTVSQEMDQIPMSEGDSYSVPFNSASGGELRSVLVAAPMDPDDPYQWESHYSGRVNHTTGAVLMTFIRPGPYLLKINRQAVSTYVELWVGCAAASKKKEKSCKTKKIPSPSAGLMLISSSANDNGFLVNARNSIGAGNYTPVADVQDAIDAITAMPGQGSVAIIDHGAAGEQSVGDGQGTSVGGTIKLSEIGGAGSWTERFMAACRPKVTTLTLYGCDVGAGANGASFLQGLANGGNMTAQAYDKQVICTKSVLWWGGNWYMCVDATLVSKTPAP